MVILLAVLCPVAFYEPLAFWSAYPVVSLAVAIALATLGILGLASAFLFEERFEIHPNRVTITLALFPEASQGATPQGRDQRTNCTAKNLPQLS